jgi:hypothetical protein
VLTLAKAIEPAARARLARQGRVSLPGSRACIGQTRSVMLKTSPDGAPPQRNLD